MVTELRNWPYTYLLSMILNPHNNKLQKVTDLEAYMMAVEKQMTAFGQIKGKVNHLHVNGRGLWNLPALQWCT